jgi:hypothetical protein
MPIEHGFLPLHTPRNCNWFVYRYAYVRGAFKHWRKHMKHTLPGSRKHDPEYFVDIDGVGEILDNLRGAGLGDASDPMVCELSVWLLDNQNDNGSFPCWFRGGKEDLDNYDRIHSTWVCTQVRFVFVFGSAARVSAGSGGVGRLKTLNRAVE